MTLKYSGLSGGFSVGDLAFPPGLQVGPPLGHTSSEGLFFVRIALWLGRGAGVGVLQGPAAPSPPLHLPTPQKWMSVPLELKAGAVSRCPLSSPPGLRRLL